MVGWWIGGKKQRKKQKKQRKRWMLPRTTSTVSHTLAIACVLHVCVCMCAKVVVVQPVFSVHDDRDQEGVFFFAKRSRYSVLEDTAVCMTDEMLPLFCFASLGLVRKESFERVIGTCFPSTRSGIN